MTITTGDAEVPGYHVCTPVYGNRDADRPFSFRWPGGPARDVISRLVRRSNGVVTPYWALCRNVTAMTTNRHHDLDDHHAQPPARPLPSYFDLKK